MFSLFGCLNLASYIAFLPESVVRLKSTEEENEFNLKVNFFINILWGFNATLLYYQVPVAKLLPAMPKCPLPSCMDAIKL